MQVGNEITFKDPESCLVEAVSKRDEHLVTKAIERIDCTKISSVILKRRGQRQQNLLHIATKDGQITIFKLLLDKIQDKTNTLKARDIHSNHPLHLALLGNHVELARYILENISEQKERNNLLNDNRGNKKCQDCIKSPEALELVYEMYDDEALKYKAPHVIGKYYYSEQPLEYRAIAFAVFRRAFLALPRVGRKNYVMYNTISEVGLIFILEKAITVADSDNFQLLDLILQGLLDTDAEKVCTEGLRYTTSVNTLEYLRNHIANKKLLLNNLETICVTPTSSTQVSRKRKTRGSLLLDFLDDKSLLSLRLASKANREFVSQIQGPYASAYEFIAANSGIYSSSAELRDVMASYFTTINSTSSHPAVLYKMREHSFGLSPLYEFSESYGENLVDTGRKYTPKKHTWNINAAWVLAQLHKGRDFVFLSDLVDPYVKRQDGSGSYSALTKEVACVIIKAGYRTSVETSNPTQSTFFLRKPFKNNNQLCQFKIKDFLELKNEECEQAVSLVQSHLREDVEATKTRVDCIIKYFMSIHDCHDRETFELIDLQEIQIKFEQLGNYLSLYCHVGKSLPEAFLTYYNEKKISLNLHGIIPELPSWLDFKRPWHHKTATKLIPDILSKAFLNLYCEKDTSTVGNQYSTAII